jgi:hypothetical protein
VGEELAFVHPEESKEPELVRGELDEVAVSVDGALFEVDPKLPDLDHRLAGGQGPAEDGSQPGK